MKFGSMFQAVWSIGIAAVLVLSACSAEQSSERAHGSVANASLRNEEVVLHDPASGVALAGTLTMPAGAGPFPAAVLTPTGLPNDRDGTHPSGVTLIRTLAETLAHAGIATLRCDDRGVGGSTGSYLDTTMSDFTTDALLGVEFLRERAEIDASKVGVIGMSQGALVGAIAASQSSDVAFVVMLGGSGVPAEQVFRERTLANAETYGYAPERTAAQLHAMETLFAIVRGDEEREASAEKLRQLFESDAGGLFEEEDSMLPEDTQTRIRIFLSPWYRSQFSFDPGEVLAQVRVPVLALTGGLDRVQSASQHLPAMLAALERGGNPDYSIVRVPGLNHIFQKAIRGGPAEYMTLAEDFSPLAADIVASWIRIRFQ